MAASAGFALASRLLACGDATSESAESCEKRDDEEVDDAGDAAGTDDKILAPPNRITRSHVADCEAKSQMATWMDDTDDDDNIAGGANGERDDEMALVSHATMARRPLEPNATLSTRS